MERSIHRRLAWLLLVSAALPGGAVRAETNPAWPARFAFDRSGLEIARPAQLGRFFDVVGRRSAALGYENRGLEAWVYPLKVIDDFRLSFRLQDYPLEIEGADSIAGISVRPEATVFTYSHAAFSVRHSVFAPLDEPGIVMLLDVRSVLPMTVTGTFRPRLRLMWPAGLMTPNVEWDEKAQVYWLTEESKRFVGVVGCPGARDLSVMPYQEEPRDVPLRFVVDVRPEDATATYLPIVIAGSVAGRDQAKAAYDRLLASVRPLYEANVAHYRSLEERTLVVDTPDARLNESFAWAKVGVDKGLATNPLLGTGLVAGYRTSGESERPGFGWFFGRDALWTILAMDAYGDFAAARTALDFLKKFQRADGKVPHEISQSASLIPWFTDYPYPWNSADATPLYVIGQADRWRATGDTAFLRASWDSIVKAWRFAAATDTDGNGLIENTRFGHGWVEGGALYPPHEEIYQQGVFVEASRSLAELAEVMKAPAVATQAKAAAERTRQAMERTYWLAERGFYAFATMRPPATPRKAEPGPNRARRQERLDELGKVPLVDEDTVLPAVPLWWRTLEDRSAQSEIDHLGGAALATDWGTRILSDQSRLYDPLSYHYGSVWPLFTGWTSMGAYRYGRPHVGYQALMANALLRSRSALGYVTELLSGDFNAAFGRSSHHQIWSEAMVVTPLVRGLLGIEAEAGGRTLRIAPQLPADWNRVAARNIPAGESRYDLSLNRGAGRLSIELTRQDDAPLSNQRIVLAPAFPLDARVRSVTVNGADARFQIERRGDIQQAVVEVPAPLPRTELVFAYDDGADAFVAAAAPEPGAASRGMRLIRSRAEADALHLTLDGRAGQESVLHVRSPRALGQPAGTVATRIGPGEWELKVRFDGPGEGYQRRELSVPLK